MLLLLLPLWKSQPLSLIIRLSSFCTPHVSCVFVFAFAADFVATVFINPFCLRLRTWSSIVYRDRAEKEVRVAGVELLLRGSLFFYSLSSFYSICSVRRRSPACYPLIRRHGAKQLLADVSSDFNKVQTTRTGANHLRSTYTAWTTNTATWLSCIRKIAYRAR